MKINVTSSCTYNPTTSTALTTSHTVVTITYGEKTTTQAITVIGTATLGRLITDPKTQYGYKVSGYSANGVSDWSVFYEDETNGYVFLIATNSVGAQYIIGDDTAGVEAANSSELYKKFKLGQTGCKLKDYGNSQAVAYLVNHFGGYANPSNSKIASYVEGAIGGPTIELFAAAYKAKVGTTITVGTSTYGYTVNGTTYQEITDDEFYCKSSYQYWLASPSNNFYSSVMIVGKHLVIYANHNSTFEVRPVVCLKSNIPATLSETTFTIGI